MMMSGLRPYLSLDEPIVSDEKTPPSTMALKMTLTASENSSGTSGKASGWTPPSGGTEPGALLTAIA